MEEVEAIYFEELWTFHLPLVKQKCVTEQSQGEVKQNRVDIYQDR